MKEAVVRTIYDNFDLWNDESVKAAKAVLLERDEIEDPTRDEIWRELYEEDALNWECEKERLIEFFNDGSTWILQGTCQSWDGRHAAGTIFTDFMKIYNKAMRSCNYAKLYDENGHFYFECAHHDGTNCYEIKKLTNKGVAYLENWENNYDDRRSERYIHNQIMAKYSTLPHFANKVYGLPKVEWKQAAA